MLVHGCIINDITTTTPVFLFSYFTLSLLTVHKLPEPILGATSDCSKILDIPHMQNFMKNLLEVVPEWKMDRLGR